LGTFRILLAVCVLLIHYASKDLPHLLGTYAVESFFVISGFYMALVLTEKYTRESLGDSWVTKFYLSRYLRLYPIYILSALAMVSRAGLAATLFGNRSTIFAAWTQLLSLPHTVRNVLLFLWAMVSNLTIFFYDLVGVIAVQDDQAVLTTHASLTQISASALTANVLAWSLGVELTFYLLAPYLLKRTNRQLFGLLLLGAALKTWAIIHIGGDLPYQLFPFVFVDFLCGVLAYRFRSVLSSLSRKYAPLICYGLMLALLLALPAGLRYWESSFVTIAVTALILPTLFNYSRSSHFENRLAEFSYPFYLLHPLALNLVYSTLIKRSAITNSYLIFACETALTLAFSYVVLSLETRYVEPYRQRLGRPRATFSVAAQ
jgi:peptidoglycan/LPS O-acetylase OafA/YrhL